jgi:maltose alpha-D-glucosyltransferase/alpha-amylase
MDPVYGYEAINVEAQERSPFSLLHWMKRIIALRRQHQVFGRGSIEFIHTDNRKVLTYVRRHENTVVLCIANLSRHVQPVAIPLQPFAGLTPVEMLGQAEFPRIGDHPYFLTLGGYGFYWFQLQEVVVPVTSRVAQALDEPVLELPTLFAGVVWDSILDGSGRTILERQSLAPFLQRQRWFGGKARTIARATFADWTTLRRGAHPAFLTIVDVRYTDGGHERYALPLSMSSGADAEQVERQFAPSILSRISGARKGLLYDGLFDDGTCQILLATMQEGRDVAMRGGRLQGANVELNAARVPVDSLTPIVRSAADQSNTSVKFGRYLIMKMFRHVEPGPNPDVEIGGYLTRSGFTRVPPLLGTIDYQPPGQAPASLVMLQEYVTNQGNGWHVTIEELGRYFEQVTALPEPRVMANEARDYVMDGGAIPPHVVEAISTYLATADVLGRRTGELHVQLAESHEPAFAPQHFTAVDLGMTASAMRRHADAQFDLLEARLPSLDARAQELARDVLARRDDLLRHFADLECVKSAGSRIRCHGDYHLGQVLITEGDIIVLDFEGEPSRPIEERRTKCSPLRDVAGMLRSFSYAALTALNAATLTRREDLDRLAPWAQLWETWVGAVYLRGYVAVMRDAAILPTSLEEMDVLLQAFVVNKALYELGYELSNRPDWVRVPLAGLVRLRSPLHA